MARKKSGIDQRSRGNPYASEKKSAAGTAGAKKLMEHARKLGVKISGVARLPAVDDPEVMKRIEALGQLEDQRKLGKAPMRNVIAEDRCRVRMRVSGARKVG